MLYVVFFASVRTLKKSGQTFQLETVLNLKAPFNIVRGVSCIGSFRESGLPASTLQVCMDSVDDDCIDGPALVDLPQL